jgi:hypothetical protein
VDIVEELNQNEFCGCWFLKLTELTLARRGDLDRERKKTAKQIKTAVLT